MTLSTATVEVVWAVAGADIVLQNDNGDDILEMTIMATVGFFGGLYGIYHGTDKYRKYALVKNTPTERIRSIALGRTELEGVVEGAGSLVSQPFVDRGCVYASWEIEEYTEDPGDDDDGSGDNKSWETLDEGVEGIEFYLASTEGDRRVLVDDPSDATATLSSDCSQSFTVGSQQSPGSEVAAFCEDQGIEPTASNRRRYSQEVLEPGTSAYVLGQAVEREDPTGGRNEQRIHIERDQSSDRFIISDKSEEELRDHYRSRTKLYVGGGLLLSTICLGLWLHIGTAHGFGVSIFGGIVGLVVVGLVAVVGKSALRVLKLLDN